MIARLRGILVEKEFTRCVVEAAGVGYEASIPLSTYDRLPAEGAEVTLHIYTQVREDAIQLYGFAEPAEKSLFVQLLNVSGIGGKLALNVLSTMPAANFAAAVAANDVKALSRINGIGKRTAERMIVELRDKLTLPAGTPGAPAAAAAELSANLNDAALALEKLGFKHDAVNKVLVALSAEIPAEEQSVEKLLHAALARLNF